MVMTPWRSYWLVGHLVVGHLVKEWSRRICWALGDGHGAGRRLKGNEMSVRVPVPIATHYADPDDVEAAMRGLHDLEARDRADGAPPGRTRVSAAADG